MINKMYTLYEHIPKEIISAFENEYDLEMRPKQNLKVITLNFLSNTGVYKLMDSKLADYDSEKNITDTFYRSASAMSVSPFLTLYISEEGMKENTSYSKESKDYKKVIRILKNNVQLNPSLQGLMSYFIDHDDHVFEILDQYLANTKKNPYLMTISVDGKSIGQSQLFKSVRDNAAKEYYKDFHTLGDKVVTGRDMVCSLCLQQKEEIWGYVSIYNFYTSKTDFAPIAGGLKKELAHRNNPVCPECAAKLKKLRPVVDKYFHFTFCGFHYFLIPEVIGTSCNKETIDLILDIMVSQYNADPGAPLHLKTRLGDFSIGERKKITDSYSKEVFDYLAETDNSASYTMLFYAINNAEFKILLTIEDVFPSQFREIFRAKHKSENHDIFMGLPGKDKNEVYNLEFRFDTIKEFLPIDDKIDGDFSKTFLETVRNIFMQKKISLSLMMQRIMAIVRRRFANDLNYDLAIRKAFQTLKFMSYLGIINTSKYEYKQEVCMNGKYADFFSEHGDFFDSSAKQSVFMVGVLTQLLMNIQLHDKGAAPFRKRLNSLKLDQELIARIFTEAREKLEQYGKNYYKELEEDISELLIKGGMEKLSNDEISFFFTLGMTLYKKFKETNNQEQDN